MKKIRIFLADDHALVRDGLKLLLNAQPDMTIIGEAGDGETALQEIKALQPDVVVMDISMPQLNGAQTTERLKVLFPDIKAVALSAHEDEIHVRQMLASGAKAYVLKRTISEELSHAIRAVARGEIYLDPAIAHVVVTAYVQQPRADQESNRLSAREQEVLIDVARGYTNKEIGERLHISVKTVEGHKANLMAKLALRSRADIVRYALRRQWLQDE